MCEAVEGEKGAMCEFSERIWFHVTASIALETMAAGARPTAKGKGYGYCGLADK